MGWDAELEEVPSQWWQLVPGWDWTLVSCSWPWFPHGTALCPEVISYPQEAAGPVLGW